ncbi:RfaF ADP-heptose,LPS heptosyltransferase [uncultured Caudovirales phage]|uniref:RfaF ADP-heptose,LPS heptosyltransferase n=1 Tax=uncultured Caudovirales phage TaxID=2100421 RepID=A0A6J5SAM4_9CAUD|nr:RfaF ADP-heptose,LPS heptosyltransferase [uncultured Caudovirales phage]CAB4210659.1 RfaF ADP-heptose,LPS heptosyltransferase [uncultured Caudovirales phage]CAB4223256.1 RfaF ADP-heptose,LPS heptosyltransferase [uncultured Caudovirales phage]
MEQKPEQKPKTKGWYLSLPYQMGTGLTANLPETIPDNLKGTSFIYGDDVLLQAQDWRVLLASWWADIKPGGHLILWLPDCRYHDVKGTKVTREDILKQFAELSDWSCLEDALIDGFIYCVLLKTPGLKYEPWRKKEKHCLIVRPGAIGDALMATTIFDGLKAEGYAIDFYCHLNAVDAVANDPRLERIISTKPEHTPDNELPIFWAAWGERYDRVINLTNSVEGALLAQHWRSEFYWPDDQRQRIFTGSYLQSTHDIAGVAGPLKVSFYPTPEETAWAEQKAKEIGPFILWCLRGSAVHKWYPWAPQAICQILSKNKDVKIILSADDGAKPLESAILDAAKEYLGDEYLFRFKSLVGTGSIRKPMTLAKYAQVVVGPETGVMNAVSFDPVKKVCLLSHSAKSNLTDDWVNVTPIVPNVPCYPCHRLHHSHDYCPQDQMTSAAICATSIAPQRLVQAVLSAL